MSLLIIQGLGTKIGAQLASVVCKPFLILHFPHTLTCTHAHTHAHTHTGGIFSVGSGSTLVSETILATWKFPFSKWRECVELTSRQTQFTLYNCLHDISAPPPSFHIIFHTGTSAPPPPFHIIFHTGTSAPPHPFHIIFHTWTSAPPPPILFHTGTSMCHSNTF